MQDSPSTSTASTLADLPSHDYRVSPSTRTSIVADELNRRPELPGVIVVDSDGVLGVLSRSQYLDYLSQPFHLELYSKRPIAVCDQANPPG
jgi:hypothetical protein